MSRKQLTWKKAIVKVLKDAGTALHYNDITERIVDQRLCTTVGVTPFKTVNSILNKETNKEIFEKVAAGTFRLRGSIYLENSENDTGGPIIVLGMFWERDLVVWTRKPKILGVERDGANPVDIANQTGIYLLYDFRDIVYAGRTTDSNLGSRLSAHTRDRLKTRWNRFSWFGFREVNANGTLSQVPDNYESRDVISAMEALLIEALEPPQNRRGGDGFQGIEYVQFEDPEKKSDRLLNQLKGLLPSK